MDLGSGAQGKFHFFKYGHVVYQIKGNNAYSKIVANVSPQTPGLGSKGQNIFFSESSHVTYYKLKGMELSTMQANILSLHSCTFEWGQKVKIKF